MKRLWNAINETKISKATKNKLYLGVLIAINVLIGGGAWLLLGRLVLPGIVYTDQIEHTARRFSA